MHTEEISSCDSHSSSSSSNDTNGDNKPCTIIKIDTNNDDTNVACVRMAQKNERAHDTENKNLARLKRDNDKKIFVCNICLCFLLYFFSSAFAFAQKVHYWCVAKATFIAIQWQCRLYVLKKNHIKLELLVESKERELMFIHRSFDACDLCVPMCLFCIPILCVFFFSFYFVFFPLSNFNVLCDTHSCDYLPYTNH